MELSRRSIHYYETVLDAAAIHEESADIIVPDLFPDILRIVDAAGIACLKEKHIRDGKAEVSGIVRAGVLYMPEGEEDLQRLDLTIPFSHSFEGDIPSDAVTLFARASLLSVEAKTINPRKVQIEISVHIGVTAYMPADWTLCDTIQTDMEASLEILQQVHTAYMTVAAKDKTFSVIDELELPGSRPPISDILRADVRLSTQEIKQIGSKLVFKSTAALRMLYRGAQPSEIAVFEQEFPFSQIMEMEGLEDGCDGKVDLILSGLELEPRVSSLADSDARTVGITLHVTAQALAFKECQLDCVSDLYSTAYAVTPVFRSVSVTKLLDRGVLRQNVREMVNASAQTVIDAKVSLSPVSVQKGDDGHAFALEASVNLVYLDENGEYQSAPGKIHVSSPIELPAGVSAHVTAALTGEISAGATSEGIELRFGVDFDYSVIVKEPLSVVDGLQGDWETPKDTSEQPSVVLRRLADGEALWDISKKYNTTRGDILLANHFAEEEELPAGSLLLIPRKR